MAAGLAAAPRQSLDAEVMVDALRAVWLKNASPALTPISSARSPGTEDPRRLSSRMGGTLGIETTRVNPGTHSESRSFALPPRAGVQPFSENPLHYEEPGNPDEYAEQRPVDYSMRPA